MGSPREFPDVLTSQTPWRLSPPPLARPMLHRSDPEARQVPVLAACTQESVTEATLANFSVREVVGKPFALDDFLEKAVPECLKCSGLLEEPPAGRS